MISTTSFAIVAALAVFAGGAPRLRASLGAQFEAIMCDWLNLGLQDPDVTGSNDPLIGANTPETSWFDLSLKNGGTIRLRGFHVDSGSSAAKRFVR